MNTIKAWDLVKLTLCLILLRIRILRHFKLWDPHKQVDRTDLEEVVPDGLSTLVLQGKIAVLKNKI